MDEAMTRFKSQLGFKQYMKDKPNQWRIKVFTLSNALNKYVYRFQIYTAKILMTLLMLGRVPEFG